MLFAVAFFLFFYSQLVVCFSVVVSLTVFSSSSSCCICCICWCASELVEFTSWVSSIVSISRYQCCFRHCQLDTILTFTLEYSIQFILPVWWNQSFNPFFSQDCSPPSAEHSDDFRLQIIVVVLVLIWSFDLSRRYDSTFVDVVTFTILCSVQSLA